VLRALQSSGLQLATATTDRGTCTGRPWPAARCRLRLARGIRRPYCGTTSTGTCHSGVAVPTAYTAIVHPGPANLVLFAWQSPIAWTVSVTGSFVDDDGGGGDGIEWLVELAQSGNVVLIGSGDKERTP
jgi:hypothetical protein